MAPLGDRIIWSRRNLALKGILKACQIVPTLALIFIMRGYSSLQISKFGLGKVAVFWQFYCLSFCMRIIHCRWNLACKPNFMWLDCQVNTLLPYFYFLFTPKIVKDTALQSRPGFFGTSCIYRTYYFLWTRQMHLFQSYWTIFYAHYIWM